MVLNFLHNFYTFLSNDLPSILDMRRHFMIAIKTVQININRWQRFRHFFNDKIILSYKITDGATKNIRLL